MDEERIKWDMKCREYEKEIHDQQTIVKSLTERIDKLRLEFRKAVLLLKTKIQKEFT